MAAVSAFGSRKRGTIFSADTLPDFDRRAKGGGVPGAEVVVLPGGGLKRDATSKHFQELVKSGLATITNDSRDARSQSYTLHPGLIAAK